MDRQAGNPVYRIYPGSSRSGLLFIYTALWFHNAACAPLVRRKQTLMLGTAGNLHGPGQYRLLCHVAAPLHGG